MSLDIFLEVPKKCSLCSGTGVILTAVFSRNYTHNVIPMWRKAGVYEALYESDGHSAGEFVEALQAGVAHMKEHFAEYEKLDSPNGWGVAQNALPWLERVAAAFAENPSATIKVSR